MKYRIKLNEEKEDLKYYRKMEIIAIISISINLLFLVLIFWLWTIATEVKTDYENIVSELEKDNVTIISKDKLIDLQNQVIELKKSIK